MYKFTKNPVTGRNKPFMLLLAIKNVQNLNNKIHQKNKTFDVM